jgi:2'-hydroxyisoflavone reductase
VFNRGQREANLPDGVERLFGDRNTGDLKALEGRSWDVVLDIPSTLPRWVRDAAQLLKDSAGHFMFISSMSVYADFSEPGVDESGPTIVLENPDSEDQIRDFGGLKTLAEQEAERTFPGRTTIIRPGLIVGPGDGSDRFNYWPVRIDRGGEVLAPGTPDDRVQIIDARDLAEWVIRMAEMRAGLSPEREAEVLAAWHARAAAPQPA